jgi:hypothetical protein
MITPNSETVEGVATATYHSAPRPDLGDSGRVTITAETAGGTVVGRDLLIVSADPAYIFFWGVPDNLPASSKFDALIRIGVTDENFNPVVGGFEVDAEAIYGTIGDGTTGDDEICATYTANTIKSTYVSTNLEKDYMWSTPDNGIGAREVITVTSGFAYADTSFYLTTEYSSEDNSSIISESEIDYGSIGSFSVKIKDGYNNPLGGHRIDLVSISNGSISGSPTAITDAYGKAGFIFTSTTDSTKKAISIVVADTADARGGIFLSKKINLIQHDST